MRVPENPLSRRNALRAGAGLIAAVGLGSAFAPTAAASESASRDLATESRQAAEDKVRLGQRSANGWEMERGTDIGGAIWTRPVAGSDLSIAVHISEVAILLVHVVRRFHYEIDTLRAGDVIGFRPYDRSLTGYQTNHASGTAIDIRPGSYPPGVKGGLSPHEAAVVRSILADCEGVVAWGGDFDTADESHFQIHLPPADPRIVKVAEKIRSWNDTPGQGAGVIPAGA